MHLVFRIFFLQHDWHKLECFFCRLLTDYFFFSLTKSIATKFLLTCMIPDVNVGTCILKWRLLFLAHLSWKIKWVFLIAVVRRLSVCKLFLFSTSSPEPLGQFQPNLAQSLFWVKGIQVYSNEKPFTSHKVNNGFFLLLFSIMIIIRVYWFDLFSQVSDVVLFYFKLCYVSRYLKNTSQQNLDTGNLISDIP